MVEKDTKQIDIEETEPEVVQEKPTRKRKPKDPDKPSPVVRSFSFKPEYQKELDYVNSMHNASDYICRLIRRDMTIGEVDTDAKVKKLVQEYMANMVIMPPKDGTPNGGNEPTKEEPVIDDDVLNDYYD